MKQPASLSELLSWAPKNWGKWGERDEIGSLNYISHQKIVAAAKLVRQGKVFTLQLPFAQKSGDPNWPGRTSAQHFMVNDKGTYFGETAPKYPGDAEFADDYLCTYVQGTTQYDALGHVWIEDLLWNGFPAQSTIGGLSKASIEPIANHGIVGRGVLLDMARLKSKEVLDRGEPIEAEDLEAAARSEGVSVEEGDIVLIRTGFLAAHLDELIHNQEELQEPGLVYSRELVEWFYDHKIANLVTDTIGNEITRDPITGYMLTLHVALMRNLGILFTEMCILEDLASDCERDGVYSMLYIGAPLKIVGGTGSPVNPIAIK